jgi:Fe-S cluster biogenesis protein NfuA
MRMEPEIRITAEILDPETCRFVVDRPVFDGHAFYFADPEAARGSPLVEVLFEVEGVRAVLVHHDTVTVYTWGIADWYPVAKDIGARIRRVLSGGETPVSPSVLQRIPSEETLRHQVEALFQQEINPALAGHGGWIRLLEVQENNLFIELGGGCQGCGMARMTLRQGVERVIRERIPGVGAIVDRTDHAAGRDPYFGG